MRRDLLETWSKLLDHVVVNLPRLGEVDFWQRGGKTSNEEVSAGGMWLSAGQRFLRFGGYTIAAEFAGR